MSRDREHALNLAHNDYSRGSVTPDPKDVVVRAEVYLAFLVGKRPAKKKPLKLSRS